MEAMRSTKETRKPFDVESDEHALIRWAEAAALGLCCIDGEGELLFANPRAREALALPGNRVDLESNRGEMLEESARIPEQLRAGTRQSGEEVSLGDGDGKARWRAISPGARYEGERLVYTRWLLRDTTEPGTSEAGERRGLAELVDELRRRGEAEAELLRDRRRADEFLSIMSHELRSALCPISLGIQVLARRRQPLDDEARVRMKAMRHQTEHVVDLVDTLLEVSRLDSHRFRLDPELLDLTALVREVVEWHRESSSPTPVELVIDAPGPEPVKGQWDRLRVRRVVGNLISNAMKFGGGKAVIIAVSEQAGRARIEVRDQGVGIAPERIAGLFARSGRTVGEPNAGGLGVGLWLVKEIVDKLGGSVIVSSTVSRGSTFVVELPLDVP